MPMQPRDEAALALWQANRQTPREVVEAMLANFFVPPVETPQEYEITLRNVATEMAQ
jgi:hypothetical protein